MGGTDESDNIIELTVEEHAEAHKDLFENYGHWQDKIAWKALSGQIGKEEIVREIQILTHLGKKRPKEWCENIAKSKMGIKQKPETVEKRRLKLIGQKREFTENWKKNISEGKKGQTPWIKGKKHSVESNEKNRLSHLGKTYNKGRVHTEESRKNMSIAHRGQIPYNKGLKYEVVKCPYCNKEGGSNAMKRFHFENCGERKID